jgi:hypothetical protein
VNGAKRVALVAAVAALVAVLVVGVPSGRAYLRTDTFTGHCVIIRQVGEGWVVDRMGGT